MLTINMLGKVNVIYKGESIDDKLSQKLVALICILVLNIGRNVSKEKIAAYLWPDSNDDAAKYNLRYNLWMIRKLIPRDANGEHIIVSGKDYSRINGKYSFQCDKILLDQFNIRQKRSVEELTRLRELFKGDFLEGLYLKNCNEFNEMILFERVVCQTKQVEILKELVNLYEVQERYEEGLKILNEMISIEPYNESFVYRIIDIYGKLGNRTAGINYYKKFESMLRRNLNISPNNELKLLYASLLDSPCKGSSEKKGNVRKRKKIQIEARCLKDVEYFWVADVINEIMNTADKKYMLELDKMYVFDLSFIQNELLLDYEKYISKEHESIGFVPPVRIINGFCKFLLHATDIYDIDIKVINIKEMDAMSYNILKHIEHSKIDNIRLKY
ncbi:MAG: BTAD domain-containing putative transcriptional regulator [Eubacteriales bacterium]|nr:BTAD domain-containing putative transcriptional regulator [Eubacteriales bacterium]